MSSNKILNSFGNYNCSVKLVLNSVIGTFAYSLHKVV